MDTSAQLDYGPQNRGRPGQWGKWKGKTCAGEGCVRLAICRGLCSSHYNKQKWADGHRSPSVNPVSQRTAHLKHRYGLTGEAHDRLLAAQGGVCAVCGIPAEHTPTHWRGKLCVDHCHDTGKVRGLLCNDCNAAIGHARTERIALAMAEYLRVHSPPT